MAFGLRDLAEVYIRAKDETGAALGSFKRGMQDSAASVTRLQGLLAGLGATATLGGLALMVKQTIDAMDRLRDLEKTTGVTVEVLSGLSLAAKQSGGDLESVAGSMNKLAQNMGKDAEKFKALGISAKEPLAAFKQLSDVLVAIEDPQLRAAVAAQALGKAWQGAMPLLMEGSVRIQEMVDKGMRLSGMTKEAADRADEFNDRMAELNVTLGATKTRLVSDLLEPLNNIAQAMLTAKEAGDSFWTAMYEGAQRAFAEMMRWNNAGDLNKISKQIVEVTDKIVSLENVTGRSTAQDAVLATYRKQVAELIKKRETLEQIGKLERPTSARPAGWWGDENADARGRAFVTEASKAATTNAAQAMVLALENELAALQAVNKETLTLDKVTREITQGTKQWTQQQRDHALALAAQIDNIKRARADTEAYIGVLKAQQAEEQELNEARARMAETRDQAIKGRQEELDLAREELQIAQLEATLIGQTEAQRRETVALLRAELEVRRQIKNLGVAVDEEWMVNAAREAAAIRARTEALREQTRDLERQQVDMWHSVESVAHGAWTSLYDTGKSVIDRLRDAIKTGILDLLYQITLKRWIINIAASTSGTGVASSAFGSSAVNGGGGMGFMDLLGLGNNVSQLSGNGSLLNMLGIGGGTAAGLGGLSAGAGAAMGGLEIGAGLAGAEAFAGFSAAAGAGAGAAGIGAAAAIPYIGWAIAAVALIASLTKSNKIPTMGLGGFNGAFGPGGLVSGTPSPYGGDAAGAQRFVQGLYDRFDSIAGALGARYSSVSFAYDSNSGKDSQNPNFALTSFSGGRSYAVGEHVGTFRKLDEATIALESGRAIVSALQGTDLPNYIEKYFDTLTPASMDQAAIDNALNFAAALKSLRDALHETRAPLEVARDSMREFARELGTSRRNYEDDLRAAIREGLTPETLAQWQRLSAMINEVTAAEAQLAAGRRGLILQFSSERQRMEVFRREIESAFDELGIAAPTTRNQFRRLVEGLDLSTTAGIEMFNALVAIAPAFDAVTEAAEDATRTLQQLRAMRRSLTQEAAEFALDIQQRIFSAGGSGSGAGMLQSMLGRLGDQYENATDSRRRLDILSEAADTVGQWLSARTAALERERSLIEEAGATRIAALEKELAIQQSWAGALAQATQMLDAMRLTSTNPLPIGGRVGLASMDVARLTGQFDAAPRDQRGALAQQLLSALGVQLGLVQEAYQRPSPEYQAAYNEIAAQVSSVQAKAQLHADRAITLQQEISALQEAQVRQLAAIDQRIAAANDQAIEWYQAIQQQGAALYKELQLTAQAEIQALNAGVTLDNYIATNTGRTVALLTQIRNQLAVTPPGFASGLEFVPYDNFVARLHLGERVQTRAEADAARGGAQVIEFKPTIVIQGGSRADAEAIAEAVDRRIQQMLPVVKQQLKRA